MAVTKFVLNETSYFGEGARSVLADEIKNRGFKKVCPFAGYRDSTDISRTHKRSKED